MAHRVKNRYLWDACDHPVQMATMFMDGDSSTITKVCKKLSDFGVDLASVQQLGRTAARLEAAEWSLARSNDADEQTSSAPPPAVGE